MRALLIATLLVTVVATASPARAEVVYIADAGVTIRTPKGWTVSLAGGTGATMLNKEETVMVMLFADPAAKTAKAMFADATEMLTELSDAPVTPTAPAAGKVGALTGVVGTATASSGGAGATATLAALPAPRGGQIGLVAVQDVGAPKKHVAALTATLASLAAVDELPTFDESELEGVPAGASELASQLAIAVELDTPSVFLPLVGTTFADGKKKLTKAKVTAAIAKKGGIAGFLKQPADAPWHLEKDGDAALVYRGSGYGKQTMIRIASVAGTWQVTGTVMKNLGAP